MSRFAYAVLLGSLLLLMTGSVRGQDNDGSQGQTLVFHVTSVSQEDDTTYCQPTECSATKFTVEGYTDTLHVGKRINYVLTCDEITSLTRHIVVKCFRVHADNDYDATLLPDSIAFADSKPKPQTVANPPRDVAYDIQLEREVAKPRK
jgi:hypothetical protein